jgi:hypothetical protein
VLVFSGYEGLFTRMPFFYKSKYFSEKRLVGGTSGADNPASGPDYRKGTEK